MRWPLRRKAAGRRDRNHRVPPPRPRADHARIAVLEYTERGIIPAPGTAAAAAVGMYLTGVRLRQAMATPVDQALCPHDDVVTTTTYGQARDTGLCTVCGAPAVRADDGAWVFL